ncbi:hypothetical protein BKA62DRAFT_698099 [Auriculariales sp. MPI-PUGE-AT-0066]|nr:hypothetical protein BKA62DRAFT_698099 [Auriculariales sp. MPI-PUGE-AT-0066]
MGGALPSLRPRLIVAVAAAGAVADDGLRVRAAPKAEMEPLRCTPPDPRPLRSNSRASRSSAFSRSRWALSYCDWYLPRSFSRCLAAFSASRCWSFAALSASFCCCFCCFCQSFMARSWSFSVIIWPWPAETPWIGRP